MNTFSIENKSLKAVFLSYGAILHQLWVKDKNGIPTNVIRGLKTTEEYLTDEWARGAVLGRFAGRLENPIQIDHKNVEIEHQNGVLLHSGSSGWHQKEWTPLPQKNNEEICFQYKCMDGSSGFPGTIQTQVCYKLEGSSLSIHYQAVPSKNTHINMTNHAYFNLDPSTAIDNQLLTINADSYLELKNNSVPNGKMKTVDSTIYDFRKAKKINKIRLDDYFVLNQNETEISELYAPSNGIRMLTYTDQPGVVIFTPPHFEAICFETQKFSNTPNVPSFPSTLIRANENYVHRTRFEFKTQTEL